MSLPRNTWKVCCKFAGPAAQGVSDLVQLGWDGKRTLGTFSNPVPRAMLQTISEFTVKQSLWEARGPSRLLEPSATVKFILTEPLGASRSPRSFPEPPGASQSLLDPSAAPCAFTVKFLSTKHSGASQSLLVPPRASRSLQEPPGASLRALCFYC